MRSAGGTKSGEPVLVVLSTNCRMAFFAAPSLHEGSVSAAVAVETPSNKPSARNGRMVFKVFSSSIPFDGELN
jgi:hypothetical protein